MFELIHAFPFGANDIVGRVKEALGVGRLDSQNVVPPLSESDGNLIVVVIGDEVLLCVDVEVDGTQSIGRSLPIPINLAIRSPHDVNIVNVWENDVALWLNFGFQKTRERLWNRKGRALKDFFSNCLSHGNREGRTHRHTLEPRG